MTNILSVEQDYYSTIKDDLVKNHLNKFVVIKGRQQHGGIFSSFEDAHQWALGNFGVVDILIQQVFEKEPVIFISPFVSSLVDHAKNDQCHKCTHMEVLLHDDDGQVVAGHCEVHGEAVGGDDSCGQFEAIKNNE